MNSMNTDGLFWYPMINFQSYWRDGKFDKGYMLQSYIRYYLARLQSMFEYKGLPDTIPQKWLEHYLLCNGNALIVKVDDELYAAVGGHGGEPDAYYVPTKYVLANPYLVNKTFSIDNTVRVENEKASYTEADSVLIYNDTYAQGVLPLLQKYCGQLVENDISMNIADILARASINISAKDDKTKASAEVYLKRLRAGELGVMSEQAFIDGLNIREFKDVASSLIPLIEYHQYVKASLFNELGLNSNYNMKRESINSNESQLNDDMLHPLIDNMLKERREGVERINKMFGTNIEVNFAGAWLSNEIEEQTILDNMALSSGVDDLGSSDDVVSDHDDESSDVDDADVKIYPDEAETETEVEEITDVEPETEVEEETPTQLVEALEALNESVEELTEAISDDESEVQEDAET